MDDITRILTMAPAEWEALAGEQPEEAERLADITRILAVNLARFTAYHDARRHGKGHPDAVRDQNQAAAYVRRALGYTTYRDDKFF